MPNPLNTKNTSIESIKALVVPFEMFERKTTTNAKINCGKNSIIYANTIFTRLDTLPSINIETTRDKIITTIRFAMIEVAIAKIFPKNTLILGSKHIDTYKSSKERK